MAQTPGEHKGTRLFVSVRCAGCGYNLRGLDAAGVCPECARPVAASLPAWFDTGTDPITEAGGRIEVDRPCLSCGYNLRGLAATDLCPECGTPVARSLKGNLLRFSSTDYVASLHRGVILIQSSIGGMFLLYATFFVAQGATSIAGGSRWVISVAFPGVLTVGQIAMGFVSIFGWWLFSAPDPALGERDEGATARVVVRVTLLIQTAANIVTMAVGRGFVSRQGPAGVVDVLGSILGVASLIAFAVWWFAAMRYIRMLAPRLPSDRVYKRAKTLVWLGPLLLILLCIGWFIDLILYFHLLDIVRKELRIVRQAQAADLEGERITGP